ncbi:hypothetical protein FR943_00070 [Mycobacterium sp. TNTM28]|uniref:ESX-1 secretion-associated protein n=1 Tax=[Mycobacterium] fortunisiensis TaxID=2600579 RepID=A0ABS6KF97_9MYCO|nr:type VII secretion target [[Mycobacterium] fortunisiensis]MBU9762253.1 hypothetical protein [[Mycobacterium] fortunisiensis]
MSGGQILKVDPAALTTAGTAFSQAGASVAGLGADAVLADAAAAVPQLATAGACHDAQSAVSAATTAVADAANTFGSNLSKAASGYESQDEASAASIKKVEMPGG